MRKKLATTLLGAAMAVGLLAAPVADTAATNPTAQARADTYTSVQHHCYSNASSMSLRTRWGSTYYTRSLSKCQNGPTGLNGGHIPTHFWLPAAWCAENLVYNNGTFSYSYKTSADGWNVLSSYRHNKIKLYRC